MGDATGPFSTFQIVGNIETAGGSCLTYPAAAQHDIKGNLTASGANILGAGVYTLDGYVAFGANGGGNVTCGGQTVGVKGTDVTFIVSGKAEPSSGSCKGQAFCVGAGYSGIVMVAPTSGALAKVVVVGPQSTLVTRGAAFTEGGSNGTLSGAFYFPNGPITMSGGAGISGTGDYCLQLIGSRITLTGGTAAASECIAGAGASTAKKVVLVQ
jgi:hypothetical protein